jgi:hypothetical protein
MIYYQRYPYVDNDQKLHQRTSYIRMDFFSFWTSVGSSEYNIYVQLGIEWGKQFHTQLKDCRKKPVKSRDH